MSNQGHPPREAFGLDHNIIVDQMTNYNIMRSRNLQNNSDDHVVSVPRANPTKPCLLLRNGEWTCGD